MIYLGEETSNRLLSWFNFTNENGDQRVNKKGGMILFNCPYLIKCNNLNLG